MPICIDCGERMEQEADAMIWEIVNPSDAYTAEAPDLKTATLASCILGYGRFPWKSQDGMESTPMCMFGVPWHEIGNITGAGDEAALSEAIDENAEAIADALDSVLIGSFQDRQTFADAMAAIDDLEKRKTFANKWHDQRRSSMNNIGAAARAYAKALRGKRAMKLNAAEEPKPDGA